MVSKLNTCRFKHWSRQKTIFTRYITNMIVSMTCTSNTCNYQYRYGMCISPHCVFFSLIYQFLIAFKNKHNINKNCAKLLFHNKISTIIKKIDHTFWIFLFDFIWQKSNHVYVYLIEFLSWFIMPTISMVYKNYIVYWQKIYRLYTIWVLNLALIICLYKLRVK